MNLVTPVPPSMPGNRGCRHGNGWTDERVEILKALWADGESATEIAVELGGGLTRNAVIGKVHRLGLAGRRRVSAFRVPKPKKPRPPASLNRFPRAGVTTEPAPIEEALPPPEAKRLSILDLTMTTCRFPLGDPGADGFAYCGCETESPPYCPYHDRVAHEPLAVRRARTLRAIANAAKPAAARTDTRGARRSRLSFLRSPT
ncbi:MAG: GcrA family cell cycle regulator [Xanthobacteraceae bacterium]